MGSAKVELIYELENMHAIRMLVEKVAKSPVRHTGELTGPDYYEVRKDAYEFISGFTERLREMAAIDPCIAFWAIEELERVVDSAMSDAGIGCDVEYRDVLNGTLTLLMWGMVKDGTANAFLMAEGKRSDQSDLYRRLRAHVVRVLDILAEAREGQFAGQIMSHRVGVGFGDSR